MRIFTVLLVGLLTDFAAPVYAVQATVNCKLTPNDPSCPARIADLITVIEKIIGLLAPAAGIAFFIMLLVGGYKFITSGGDPKAVGSARSTLTYAVVGIILVVAAWLILQLIASLTGADVTTVTLPTN